MRGGLWFQIAKKRKRGAIGIAPRFAFDSRSI
jgi:hypothetical protein